MRRFLAKYWQTEFWWWSMMSENKIGSPFRKTEKSKVNRYFYWTGSDDVPLFEAKD
jgi:hypothetical protein